MASYATLSLGSLVLEVTRNDVHPAVMWIFRPSDKHAEQVDNRNRHVLEKYVDEDFIDEYDENNPFTRIEYRCTARAARDRLDLKGFTCEVAETSFNTALESTIQYYEGWKSDKNLSRFSGLVEEKLRILRVLTFSSWLEALRRIWEENLTKEQLHALSSDDEQLLLLNYMLVDSMDCYGFPGVDPRHLLRVALEVVSSREQLTYDLSDLLAGGWIEEADDLVTIAEGLINEDFLLAQRVIVLTEGDTDREFLERSLRLLYPHLADYFHFFDFTGRKVAGGAGELSNLVRAFAAADVRHRILALFDNDTAAKASLSNLDLNGLPSNIAVRHYPSLPLAQNYPTLGPSGKARMDVNGLAGSIELYLGKDVLMDADGILSPVQWKGYDNKVSAYQGEILDKRNVLKRFRRKLTFCETDPDLIGNYDWDGIQAIIDVMRTAFHGTDTEAILSEAIYE